MASVGISERVLSVLSLCVAKSVGFGPFIGPHAGELFQPSALGFTSAYTPRARMGNLAGGGVCQGAFRLASQVVHVFAPWIQGIRPVPPTKRHARYSK